VSNVTVGGNGNIDAFLMGIGASLNEVAVAA
jgi:hypothetical protein